MSILYFRKAYILLSLVALLGCQDARNIKLELRNNGDYPVVDYPVTITSDKFPEGIVKSGLFPEISDSLNQVLPSQLIDNDGDGKWDELFFAAGLSAGEKKTVTIQWKKNPQTYTQRARVRFGKRQGIDLPVKPMVADTFYAADLPKLLGYQPYQTDGPTWENDKIAFRHYFDGRNAKDFFGKRTSEMSPDSVGISSTGGVEDNYHVLKDWGRDILPVGNTEGLSLGIGGIGLQIGGRLTRIGVTATDSVHTVDKTALQVVASGPEKAILQLDYFHWKPFPDRDYRVAEKPVIWPGMYAYQNTVSFENLQGDETLLVGLPKAATDKPLTEFKQGKWVVVYTHDYQTYNKEYILGLALILPADIYEGFIMAPEKGALSLSYLAQLRIRNNTSVSYYAVGCWELSDPGFKDEAYFKNYLTNFVEQLDASVSVEFVK